jgi:WD40 repeat protein
MAEGRGIGYHISQSPVRDVVGTKIILDNGLQVPVLYDLKNDEIIYLQAPVHEAGQVSFTRNGVAAWTSGRRFHLSDGRSCDLPAYANLAPVSPNGKWVVSNDDSDQLWLTDIGSGKHIRVSPALEEAFYNPQWSPDGKSILFSSVGGTLWVYFLETGSSHPLTEGQSAVWKDSSTILFHRIDVQEGKAVNADLYACDIHKGTIENLTDTPDRFEMDPFWDKSKQRILFHTRKDGSIVALSNTKGESILYTLDAPLSVTYYPPHRSSKGAAYYEIPYVNQVYDPPDWFGAGSAACGGTAAVMCLAYYGTITPWPTTASRPYPHKSPYGRYICDKYYTILGYYMDRIGYSRGNYGWGAFGYITQNNWSDTKGYMAEYAWKNGMANKPVDWTPTRAEVIQQVDKRMPFVLLNSLTSSGHYISTIGYENSSATTLIFNDPYGNKNTPGYPSYDGALSRYDWPGYNNGYQNLNEVHCFIYFQGNVLTKPDIALEQISIIQDTIKTGSTIINEISISNQGDTLFVPTCIKYKLNDIGVNNLNIDTILYTEIIKSMYPKSKMRFKHTIILPDSLISDTYKYTIEIPADTQFSEIRFSNNRYEKEVKLIGYPHVYATAPEKGATVNSTTPVLFAKFRETIDKVDTDSVFLSLNGVNINTDCSWNTREIRRTSEAPLEPGEYTAEVRVRNLAGFESVYTWTFTLTSTALEPEESRPGVFALCAYPNPFNPRGIIHVSLPESGHIRLDLFDIRGRHVKTLENGFHTAGTYQIHWGGTDTQGHPATSGVYIARLTSTQGYKTIRFVLLK